MEEGKDFGFQPSPIGKFSISNPLSAIQFPQWAQILGGEWEDLYKAKREILRELLRVRMRFMPKGQHRTQQVLLLSVLLSPRVLHCAISEERTQFCVRLQEMGAFLGSDSSESYSCCSPAGASSRSQEIASRCTKVVEVYSHPPCSRMPPKL